MIRVARSSPNSGPLNRNEIAANAYAAIEHVTSWPTVFSRRA